MPNSYTQILFVTSQLLQRFRNAPEHQIIAILLVAINQRIQFLWNGKYHMKIAYIQKIDLSEKSSDIIFNILEFGLEWRQRVKNHF